MLLAFDTTLDACSVALLTGAEVAAKAHVTMGKGHAEALVPMIEAVLADAGCPMEAVTRIAVTAGPGTFTGVRVGISAARGLALALKIPATGVPTLELIAGAAVLAGDVPRAEHLLATIDARRGQAYVALYKAGDAAAPGYPLTGVKQHAAVPLDNIDAWLEDSRLPPGARITAIGGAAQLLGAASERLDMGGEVRADAAQLARLAARLPESAWVGRPEALYIRPPDAKLPAAAP